MVVAEQPRQTAYARARHKRQTPAPAPSGSSSSANATSTSSPPAAPPLTTPPLLTADKPTSHDAAELSTLAALQTALFSAASDAAKSHWDDNAATLSAWASVFGKSSEEVAAWLTSSASTASQASASASSASVKAAQEAAAAASKTSAEAAAGASREAEQNSRLEEKPTAPSASSAPAPGSPPAAPPPAEKEDSPPPALAPPVTEVITVNVPTTVDGKPTEVKQAITTAHPAQAIGRPSPGKTDEGLSTGAFIGIAIAGVVLLTTLLFVCICICKRRRRQRRRRVASEAFLPAAHRPAYEADNLPSGISPASSRSDDDDGATITPRGGGAATTMRSVRRDSTDTTDAQTLGSKRSYMPTLARFFPPKPPPRPTSAAITMAENSAGIGAGASTLSRPSDSRVSYGNGTIATTKTRDKPPRALQPGLDSATLAPSIKPPPPLPLPYKKPTRDARGGDGKTMRRARYSLTTSLGERTDGALSPPVV